MVCDLNRGRPLAKGDSDSVTISFDVSQLSGQSLIIYAEVFSTGYEKNPTDNKQTNVIGLKEFTEIDASGYVFIILVKTIGIISKLLITFKRSDK